MQGKLEAKEEEVKYWRENFANNSQSSKVSLGNLISQLRKEPETAFQEEQEIFGKVKDILAVKRVFLNARQKTIRGLQNCYGEVKENKKSGKVNKVIKIIGAVGSVADSLTFGIPKALSETIKIIDNSFQGKFSEEQTKNFKKLLTNDKENFLRLNKVIIDKVHSSQGEQELRLFRTKYKIFEIDSAIWEERVFSTLEEMKEIIILLDKNLNKLKDELEEEEKQFKGFLELYQTKI